MKVRWSNISNKRKILLVMISFPKDILKTLKQLRVFFVLLWKIYTNKKTLYKEKSYI